MTSAATTRNDKPASGLDSVARLAAYLLLLGTTVLGVWAIAVRFREGLLVTRMTQHVPWGFWIALYIYFIGLSAGSFLLSTLVYVFRVRRFEAVGPLALVQALLCLALGMVLIWIDLGHPARFFNVFRYWNVSSVLAWESGFYVLYTLIILMELFLALRPWLAARAQPGRPWAALYRILALGREIPGEEWKQQAARWLRILGIVGIPVAVAVHGGTGAIFAVVKSRPSWYTGLFPVVFLVSALASGGALLTFLTAVLSRLERERKLWVVRGLAQLTVAMVTLDLLLMASELLVVFYGGIPHHQVGWWNTLFGPFWWVFWLVQLGFGAALPIALVSFRRTGRSTGWLGLAGALVVVGIVGLRLNIVVPAQIEPQFASLPHVLHHSRFAAGYFPSGNEWLVGLGVVVIGVWLFLLAVKVLPLAEAEKAHLTASRAPDSDSSRSSPSRSHLSEFPAVSGG